MIAQGRYLAEFHKASWKFAHLYPDAVTELPSWDTIDKYRYRKHLKAPCIEKTPDNYGITFGEFHSDNFLLNGSEIATFNFERLQQGYFLNDLGTLLFELTFRIEKSKENVKLQKQICEWLCEGYGGV